MTKSTCEELVATQSPRISVIGETKLIPPPPEPPRLRMVNEDDDCWFTKWFTRGE